MTGDCERRTIRSPCAIRKKKFTMSGTKSTPPASASGAVANGFPSEKRSLASLLADYQDQAELKARFAEFADSSPNAYRREHPPGHFTGSAWLVSADRQRVLLTHHKKLARWLQLGGHADGETDLAKVALTEALEESGLVDLRIDPQIFDLDVHVIPARKTDPEHLHWDVRFVVFAEGSEQFAISEESLALAWRSVADVANDPDSDDSLRRMAGKWLAACQ